MEYERSHNRHVLNGIWNLLIYICLMLNMAVLILYPMFRILQIGLAFIVCCQKRSHFPPSTQKAYSTEFYVNISMWLHLESGYSQEIKFLAFRTSLKSSSCYTHSSFCCFLVSNLNETKSDWERTVWFAFSSWLIYYSLVWCLSLALMACSHWYR